MKSQQNTATTKWQQRARREHHKEHLLSHLLESPLVVASNPHRFCDKGPPTQKRDVPLWRMVLSKEETSSDFDHNKNKITNFSTKASSTIHFET